MTIFSSACQHTLANSVHHWQMEGIANAYNRPCSLFSEQCSASFCPWESRVAKEFINNLNADLHFSNREGSESSISLSHSLHRSLRRVDELTEMFHLHCKTRHSVTYASYVADGNNINFPYDGMTYWLLSHGNVLSAKVKGLIWYCSDMLSFSIQRLKDTNFEAVSERCLGYEYEFESLHQW